MSFFSKGVTKDKLTVLYFFDALSIELTRDQITTFSGENEIIPYFDLQSAVYALEEEGMLAAVPRQRGQCYCITPRGKDTLEMFKERLPLSHRKELDAAAEAYREKLLRESQFTVSIERAAGGGWRTTLRTLERNDELMGISILLPDRESAKKAAAIWPDRALAIYTYLINELLGEGEN